MNGGKYRLLPELETLGPPQAAFFQGRVLPGSVTGCLQAAFLSSQALPEIETGYPA